MLFLDEPTLYLFMSLHKHGMLILIPVHSSGNVDKPHFALYNHLSQQLSSQQDWNSCRMLMFRITQRCIFGIMLFASLCCAAITKSKLHGDPIGKTAYFA